MQDERQFCFHQFCCARRCTSTGNLRTTLILGSAFAINALISTSGCLFLQQLGAAGKNTNSQHASGLRLKLRGGEAHTRLPSLQVEFDGDSTKKEKNVAKAFKISNDTGTVLSQNPVLRGESDDGLISLLRLLGLAVLTEVVLPLWMVPSTYSLAHHFYDKMSSQPIRFLPTDLPPSLIDRNVTRVQLDTHRAFKYIEQYDVVKELGMGSSGRVFQVRDAVTGKQYAVKVLNKKMLQEMHFGNQNLLKCVETEIQIMLLLGGHPNILRLFEVMDSVTREAFLLFLFPNFVGGNSLAPCTDLGQSWHQVQSSILLRTEYCEVIAAFLIINSTANSQSIISLP